MGVCPGGFGRTPPETIGDSKTEFNRILCTSKSEAAVTSNKKLRCRYVEANYWQTWSIARFLCDSRATCNYHCDTSYRSAACMWTDPYIFWYGMLRNLVWRAIFGGDKVWRYVQPFRYSPRVCSRPKDGEQNCRNWLKVNEDWPIGLRLA